jgi:hypothetical protein
MLCIFLLTGGLIVDGVLCEHEQYRFAIESIKAVSYRT